MKLMIIESPGKTSKLSAILGPSWKIAASVGHIRDLPQKEMGVAGPDYRPDYVLTERGRDVVKRLKAMVKNANEVYLATDPDREGESISWHLKEALGLKSHYRVSFNEITKGAVEAALRSPRQIDNKLVAAQEARRVLDRLVGYTVSPALTRQSGQNLTAGRVQSPAVRLVVEREREINAFRVTEHFGVALLFGDANPWRAEWLTKPNFVSEDSPYFTDRTFAEAVAQVTSVIVQGFEESESKRSPPPPFTTSTLQQAASVSLGLNPKATMATAQKLYEQGHITYHRTDNPNISEESMPEISRTAAALGLEMAPSIRKFKAPEGAQVGHPAVTPTHWDAESAGETEEQKALYRLIRLRAIASQLADAKYAVRVALLQGTEATSGKIVEFEARGRTLIYAGWLGLVERDQTVSSDEEKGEVPNPIPLLEAGQEISVDYGKLLEKKTKPPPRYTEASLVKKLESAGIGRPATYASIMDNISARGYVQVAKKFLIPTVTGETIVDALVGKFAFIELPFTKAVEAELDQIAAGSTRYQTVVSAMHGRLEKEMDALQVSPSNVGTPQHPCPECSSPMRRIKGKSGFFWGCSRHPECKTTLPDSNGKPGLRQAATLSEHACPTCGKPLVHRKKEGKGGYDFWGCSGFKDGCKQSFPNAAGKPDLTPKP